jgi:subtilisin family serine protease
MTPRRLLSFALVAALLGPGASLPVAGADGPGGVASFEDRLDPFLKRVVRGSRVVRGRFATALPSASPEVVRSLPPFVLRERPVAGGAAPILYVKARAAGAAARPGPERARLLERLAAEGATVRAAVGPILSLGVPPRALAGVARLDGLAWIKSARSYRLQNEVSTGPAHLAADEAQNGLGARGAGVIAAVVDTGLEWSDRDFRRADGTTRVLGIWDMTLPEDPLIPPPPGFGFGRYYDRARIDAALAAGGSLDTGDGHGHGTHVAGSFAGNGLQTGNSVPAGTFAGVAPEADLLVVRVFDDAGVFCAACDLTAAVQFIRDTAAAAGRPWVGNMSLGTDLGSHDGTDPDEIAIDAAVGPGRRGAQMAIAAGNSGARRMHWEGTLSAGAVFTNTFGVNPTPRAGADNDFIWMDLWYDGTDQASFEVTTPGGTTVSAAPGVDSGIVCTPDGAVQVDAGNRADPENGDSQVFTQIWDAAECGGTPPRAGTWTLRLRVLAVGAAPGSFDLWNEADLDPLITHVTLQTSTLDESIGIPATGRHALTAGSYIDKCQWTNAAGNTVTACNVATVGTLSSFSSVGPTRDGRVKPDVAAPGEWIGSSLAGAIGASRGVNFTERDGVHGLIRGTSMAAPHVAGVAALVLALNPDLTGPEVRAAVLGAARSDAFTGVVPNTRFGAGKLRAPEAVYAGAALVTDLAALSGTAFGGTGSALMDGWNVYRGAIPGLSASSYGTCFLSGLPSPAFTDAAAPAPGAAFSYLVTGVRAGVEGILGVDSAGRVRPNASPCP